MQNIAILYKTHAEIVKKKTEILQNIVMLYKIHDEIIKKKTEILQNIVMLYNTDYVYIYIYTYIYLHMYDIVPIAKYVTKLYKNKILRERQVAIAFVKDSSR